MAATAERCARKPRPSPSAILITGIGDDKKLDQIGSYHLYYLFYRVLDRRLCFFRAVKPVAGRDGRWISKSGRGRSRHLPLPADSFPGQEKNFFERVWGVDSVLVKYTESGEVIRFSYHVIDAEKAKPLSDKKLEPFLVDPQAGVKLVIPSLENIGMLRQTAPPEPGKSYWMGYQGVLRRKQGLLRPAS